jgi:hypothetical protein
MHTPTTDNDYDHIDVHFSSIKTVLIISCGVLCQRLNCFIKFQPNNIWKLDERNTQ